MEENWPRSLAKYRDALARCVEAFAQTLPVQQVILFGSHASGHNRPDSDVDLCVIVRGIESQQEAARTLRKAIGRIRSKPPLSLVPISPERLAEKQRIRDPFFETVMSEGVCLAEAD